ncbi:MAG TPA: hypothetical protein VKS43_14880, partial [Burkholderiales bacterium]|nr:hypothetical protein [Burkholderiales bacterium]
QQFAAAMNKALYITGHSKGGAVANLAAARFSLTEGMSPHVCTFAAAHPGDESFAKAYDKAVIDSTRYEYADDIVPHLPPSPAFGPLLERIAALRGLFGKLAYAHVGQLRFIDWSGDVIDDQPFLDVKRFAKLLELLTQLKFDEIVDDHAIDDPQSGYMKAIIPSGL